MSKEENNVSNIFKTLTFKKKIRNHIVDQEIDITIEKNYNEDSGKYEVMFKENDLCYISLYLTNRHYGGPEEGGWWYNTNHLYLTVPTIFNTDAINKIVDNFIKDKVEEELYGDINSVLGGQDGSIIIEKVPGNFERSEHQTYC